MTRALYSIGAVARMLGVPVATLRSWEARYGVVVPQRSAGGQRLYSRRDVEQLRFVADRLEEGFQPAEAHRLLLDRRAMGADELAAAPSGRLLILLAERDRFAAELAEYFLRTEGFDVDLALGAGAAGPKAEAEQPAYALAVIEFLIDGGSGGLALCRSLKAVRDIPVVVVSTLDVGEAAFAAGADAFMAKPLDPLQLISTVRDLLGSSAVLHRPVPAG
jgi:DNA-binding transcriptional MerR regulator